MEMIFCIALPLCPKLRYLSGETQIMQSKSALAAVKGKNSVQAGTGHKVQGGLVPILLCHGAIQVNCHYAVKKDH